MQWHYVKDGQAAGPVDEPQMAELERQGLLNAGSMVWTEGMAEWKPLSACRDQLPEPLPVDPVLPAPEKIEAPAPLEILAPRALSEAQPLFPDEAPAPAPVLKPCSICGKQYKLEELHRHEGQLICSPCDLELQTRSSSLVSVVRSFFKRFFS